MNYKAGQYKINGLDIFTEYGLVPVKGFYNELLKLPQRKAGYTYNWPDENGTERENSLFYESRQLDLQFAIIANDYDDFLAKYTAIRDLFLLSASFDFLSTKLNKQYRFVYSSMTELNFMTILYQNNKIVAQLTINVFDDYPLTDPVFPTYDLFYGSASDIPTTEAELLALNAAEFESPFELETGTTYRYHIIALDESVDITSVTDLDAGIFGDVTGLYELRGQIVSEGITYNIFAMETGIPYSTTHTHKFILN